MIGCPAIFGILTKKVYLYCFKIEIMDDIVIIILTLIFFGVSILGQVKRKKKPDSALPEVGKKEEPQFWETLFEEFGVQQSESVPQTTAEHQYQADYETIKNYSRKSDHTPPKYISKKIESQKLLADKQAENERMKPRKIHPEMKDFSLKKAVIYSEIISPKYLSN